MNLKKWALLNVFIAGLFFIYALINNTQFYGMIPNLIGAGYFFGKSQ